MLSYLRRNRSEEQRQKLRQRANRLSMMLAVLIAAISTYDAWPAPGKKMGRLAVAELVVTWLGVAVTILLVPFVQRRRAEKTVSLTPETNP